jgi:hypothetical protein
MLSDSPSYTCNFPQNKQGLLCYFFKQIRIYNSGALSWLKLRDRFLNIVWSVALFLRYYSPYLSLVHTHLDARQNSPGRVISQSQRPLPTQDHTTYKHKRQTSKHRAGFEPAIQATKQPQTYALDRAANGTGWIVALLNLKSINLLNVRYKCWGSGTEVQRPHLNRIYAVTTIKSEENKPKIKLLKDFGFH